MDGRVLGTAAAAAVGSVLAEVEAFAPAAAVACEVAMGTPADPDAAVGAAARRSHTAAVVAQKRGAKAYGGRGCATAGH